MAAFDDEAQRNLDALAATAQAKGVTAYAARLHGSPIPTLLDYEEMIRPDLVVMASHGRTGLARFARGSVADTLIREGTAPVLLVRSFGPETASLERAVLPLDGSPLAEAAVTMVEGLAGKPLKSVELCQAVAEPEDRQAAIPYLEAVADRLRTTGLEVTVAATVGQPNKIIQAAAKGNDLVIMATHGRSGLDRLRHGSVAEYALRELSVPLLLVRPREMQTVTTPVVVLAAELSS
jgi:nucleotide-binding universal stress UspA family protein